MQKDIVNHRQTQRKTPCSSCKGLGTKVTGAFLFSFGIMNFRIIILTCFAIWGFDINLNSNRWQFFLSLIKLGNINYLKGLTDSDKEEIPFPKEKTMSILMTKTILDNESVAVMKISKYILRHFFVTQQVTLDHLMHIEALSKSSCYTNNAPETWSVFLG